MTTVAVITVVCVLCSLSLPYVQGRQITASFVFPNGTSPKESDGTLRVCVQLDMAPTTSISITVRALEGLNSEEGVNFRDPNTILVFNQSEPTEKCLGVILLKDNVVRSQSPIFLVIMSSSDPGLTIPISPELIQLEESDVLRVSFAQSSYTLPSEASPLSICAEVVGGSFLGTDGFSLIVDVTLQDDTAIAGVDYISPVQSILFTSGSTVGNQSCTVVNIINDDLVEGIEYFQAILSPTTTTVQAENGTALISITDDDAATVSIKPLTVTVIEGNISTTVTEQLCIVLNVLEELKRSVVVNVVTKEVTASDQSDFSPIQNSLTFLPGSSQGSQMCFNVSINGDDLLETDETFKVKISLAAPDIVQPEQDETIITIQHDGDVNICPSLSNPVNGMVDISGFDNGAKAEYSCNVNFKLKNGARTRICNTGAWSGSEPVCATTCPVLSVDNGTISSDSGTPYSEGDTVTYLCSTGYTLTGNKVRTCSASGWTGSDPTCILVDCGALSSPKDGRVEHATTTYLSVATYSCNSSKFTLKGQPNRQCLETSDWEGSMPMCSGAKGMFSSGVLLLVVMAVLLNLFLEH